MSTSNIQCRQCGHTLAKRHHSSRVEFAVGIRAVMLPDGRTMAVCPCGHRQAMYVTGKVVVQPVASANWSNGAPGRSDTQLDHTGIARKRRTS